MKFKYCFILLLLVCFLCGSVYAEDLNHDNLTSHSTLQKDTQVVLDENLESEEISEEVETNPDEVLGVEENEKLCSDEGIIYFDANALKDGNGSIDNPYKEFNSRTAGSIPAGSTIYLANGEYDFSNYANFDNLVIVGESSQNTIVKNIWFGSSKLFGMGSGVGSSLMLCNVTFVNSSFTYYTDISAVDCVFEGYSDLGLIASLNYENDYVSVTLDNCGFVGCECGHDSVISVEGGFLQIKNSHVGSAKNNFIYAAGSTVVLDCVDVKKSIVQGSDNLIQLESCLLNVFNSDFDENKVTGGSLIIIDGNGQLNILNSIFTNNNIDTGVVNSNYAFVNITNSNFKNNHAKRFAGAVFTAQSTLLMENNAFEKNIASWSGGAVIALNTTLQILTCNFTDNSALYSGGALYAMYGNILIEESIFNSNSALNGSAIFIDAVSPMGAGYSLFYGDVFEGKDKYSIYAINDENYDFGNEINPEDVFQTKYPNLVIGDGDYSLVKFTPSFNGTIPAYYDLRQKGYVTPIKNQGPDGNCWAFTGIATLESCILKALGTSYDFSEVNMKNLMAWFSDYGWNALPNSGGTAEMAIAYLTSWLGPVYEEEDPYSPSNSLSEVLHSHFHVQNVLFLDYDDFDSIKKAIIEYGAVGIGMAWNDDFINDAAYYC